MILKIDFEKAYDSGCGSFIFKLCIFLGFYPRWVMLIKVFLVSSGSSILLNGCPTYQFCLEWGLRQGNLLSHFLLLFIIEALNMVMGDAIEDELFKLVIMGAA